MKYCYECGEKLIEKELEHEGIVPFCPRCNKFVFPIFSAAVSMIVVDKNQTKTLIIKQYGRSFYNLVAGYINKGESAEEAVYRELDEEVGLKPISIRPLRTSYFAKSNTLMYNYLAICDNLDVKSNYEVDEYKWFNIEDALDGLNGASLALSFFKAYLDDKKNNII